MTISRLSVVLLLAGLCGTPSAAGGQVPDSANSVADTTWEAPPGVVERVAKSFSEGDAARLLAPSSDRVEVNLFGARTFYSSTQALYVLRKFFRSHVPRRFLVDDVVETGTSCFVRGTYEQAHVAQRLLVFVQLSHSEEEKSWQLQEVRIEKASE